MFEQGGSVELPAASGRSYLAEGTKLLLTGERILSKKEVDAMLKKQNIDTTKALPLKLSNFPT